MLSLGGAGRSHAHVAAMSTLEHDHANSGGGRLLRSLPEALPICWLDMSSVGHPRSVALASTAGVFGYGGSGDNDEAAFERRCRRLSSAGITSVLTLSTRAELDKLGVRQLLLDWLPERLTHRHAALTDGDAPPPRQLLQLLRRLLAQLVDGGRVLVHCASGRGRTCTLAACLLLAVDGSLTASAAAATLQRLRGSPAVQSVRQYNTVCAFGRLVRDSRRQRRLCDVLLRPPCCGSGDGMDEDEDASVCCFLEQSADDSSEEEGWSDDSRPVSR